MPRLIRHAVLLAALALSLTACGRRGPLEPPPGAPASFAPLTGAPDRYAAPRSLADLPGENAEGFVPTQPPTTEGGRPSAASEPAPPRAPPQPKSFFLDPLL